MPRIIDSNYSDYQTKTYQDWFLVVFFVVIAYSVSYTLGIYEFITGLLNSIKLQWLSEILISLIFAIIPFIIFAARRQLDLRLEIQRRKNLLEDYRNYTNQIHKVFEAVDDVVVQTDDSLRIIWANNLAVEQFEEPIGAPIRQFLYPDEDNIPPDSYLLKSFENGTVERQVKFYVAKSEKEKDRYLEHTAIPFKDTNGDVVGVTSISRDITEKMQVEESKSRLASIVESSEDAIFLVSQDGSIHSWNKSAENIFDYKAKQVVGQQVTILDHIIDFETLITIPQLGGQSNVAKRIQHVDMVPVRKKDTTIYVSLTVYPFVDETGKVLGFTTIARDITSAIKAEEALRESESRFRQLADTIEDAFWLIDWEKQKYLFTSPSYSRIWGREPASDEFDLYEWAMAVHKDDRKRVVEATLKIIENNGMVEEFRVVDNNGEIRWVRDRAFPVYNSKGEAYRVAGIAQDITENKLAEQALRESETRFKELFQNMSNGVVVYEQIDNCRDFIVKDFNEAAEFIENKSKYEVFGKNLKSILKNERNFIIIDELRQVYETGKPASYLFTLYHDEPFSQEIKGWRQNYFYKLPTGEVVSIFEDVTEKRKQDEALRESEERYRTFVTNFKGIAFRWTPDYKPIFMHGFVEEITAYDVSEFISNSVNWDSVIIPEDLKLVKDQRAYIKLNPGRSVEFEYRIARKDGKTRWLNESLLNVSDDDGNIIFIQSTIYDITQRKIAESDLLSSRQQLRNLALHLDSVREEERKQIAFEIHDELGYLLTAVKLDIAWLVKKIDTSKDNLEVKIREMSDMIELTIQKVRTISSQLRPSILDHFGLVAAIDWQSKEFQRRTAIRTKFVVTPKDLSVAEYLATPIFRIFQESLTNISRYAKASRVDVYLEQSNNKVILKVVDNGVGIDPDKIYHQDSFGLLGMREKAKSMGGEVTIRNLGLARNGEGEDQDSMFGGTEVILSVPHNGKISGDKL